LDPARAPKIDYGELSAMPSAPPGILCALSPAERYPWAMGFNADDLDLIDRTEEVRIETSMEGGPIHRAIIWVVVDDGDVFVRSAYGPDSRWYREAMANPGVGLVVAGRRLAATAVHATDPGEIDRMSRGLERKYAGDSAMPGMNRAELLPLTLRLDPA
jgi:hypothetical protein